MLTTIILFCINACNDNSETFTVSNSPTAPALADLTITKIKLDKVNTNNAALTLSWESADYGQQLSINYAIQFSKDNAFTNPVTAATVTGKNAITLSNSELNSAASSAGLNPFTWATLHARVVSSLGSQKSSQANSNVVQFMVFPYFNYPYKDYYLVGDGTAPGWDNNKNNPALYRDPNNANKFYYTGHFGNGHFKVLETKGLWQPQWGTNDGSTIEVNPGGGTDPERFPNAGGAAITPGFYTFAIDFNTKKFTFTPYDATGKTSPASLNIEGNAVGANAKALSALAFDGHIWYINKVHLTPGNVQFKTGTGDVWGSTTSFSGTATKSGGTIPVIVEDDYDVWFNDLTGRYILIPLNL